MYSFSNASVCLAVASVVVLIFQYFHYSSSPAFAPLYGNQYSHSQQQPNQNWPSSQYAGTANNSSALNAISISKRGDVDSTASNNKNSQKEKRPYKKRKHKNQREKLPYPSPGNLPETFDQRFVFPPLS